MLFWTATAAAAPTSAHLYIYMAGKKLNRLYFFYRIWYHSFSCFRVRSLVCVMAFFRMYVQYTTNQIKLVLSVSMSVLININIRSCMCVCLQPFFSSSNSRSHLLLHAHTDKEIRKKAIDITLIHHKYIGCSVRIYVKCIKHAHTHAIHDFPSFFCSCSLSHSHSLYRIWTTHGILLPLLLYRARIFQYWNDDGKKRMTHMNMPVEEIIKHTRIYRFYSIHDKIHFHITHSK